MVSVMKDSNDAERRRQRPPQSFMGFDTMTNRKSATASKAFAGTKSPGVRRTYSNSGAAPAPNSLNSSVVNSRSSVNAHKNWHVRLPRRMVITVMSIFLLLPLTIFMWKETHLHPQVHHKHHKGLFRHHNHKKEFVTWMEEAEEKTDTSPEDSSEKQPSLSQNSNISTAKSIHSASTNPVYHSTTGAENSVSLVEPINKSNQTLNHTKTLDTSDQSTEDHGEKALKTNEHAAKQQLPDTTQGGLEQSAMKQIANEAGGDDTKEESQPAKLDQSNEQDESPELAHENLQNQEMRQEDGDAAENDENHKGSEAKSLEGNEDLVRESNDFQSGQRRRRRLSHLPTHAFLIQRETNSTKESRKLR